MWNLNCELYEVFKFIIKKIKFFLESFIYTAQEMKFFIKDFFSKYDQIGRKMQIWAHLLKKSLMEKLHFLCSDKDTVRGAFFLFSKVSGKM